MSATERSFRAPDGLRLAARVHHAGAPVRVLAVHGWLDNAAGFDALAAHLPQCEIVAVDLAGHGRSGHRADGTRYHYVDYLDDLLAVLDQLGWDSSVWLGHSLGGALLAFLAAALPDRVDRLVLIESIGPLAAEPEQLVPRLRQSLIERQAGHGRNGLRVFANADEAIALRARVNGLSPAAAAALVERGLRPVADGLVWSSDPRLKATTPLRAHESQIETLLAAIACPVQLLLAKPPLPFMDAVTRESRLALLPHAQRHRFSGHHHLHMETPQPLAVAITRFLAGDAAAASTGDRFPGP